MVYDLYQDKIVSNYDEILISYVYDVDLSTIAQLSPAFIFAFECLMASKLAQSITENSTSSQTWLAEYKLAIAQAKSMDSQQKPPVSILDAPFNEVRGGGSSEGFY